MLLIKGDYALPHNYAFCSPQIGLLRTSSYVNIPVKSTCEDIETSEKPQIAQISMVFKIVYSKFNLKYN